METGMVEMSSGDSAAGTVWDCEDGIVRVGEWECEGCGIGEWEWWSGKVGGWEQIATAVTMWRGEGWTVRVGGCPVAAGGMWEAGRWVREWEGWIGAVVERRKGEERQGGRGGPGDGCR